MAKLPPVADSLDDVEEKYRVLYTEGEGGKFHLDPDIAQAQEAGAKTDPAKDEEISRLRAEAARRRKELQDFKATLGEDFDPEKYKQLKKAAEEAEQARLRAVGDWETRERQLLAKHEKELQTEREEKLKFKAQRDKVMLEEAAIREITKQKGSAKLLRSPVLERLRIDESGPDPQVVVVDERGNPMIKDGKGTPYDIAKLVEDMKGEEEYARAFEPVGLPGGGMQPNGGGNVRFSSGMDLSKLSPAEKLRLIRNGQIPSGAPTVTPGQRRSG